MELETNTSISNDARLLAQAKKLTLEPVHADVTPDDMPDSVIVAHHLGSSAVANASNDVEQDAPLITPIDTVAEEVHHSTKLYLLTATGIIALAVIISIVVISN